MASQIRVTRTGTRFAEIVLARPRVMREIGEGLRARIVNRTRAGFDAAGRPFRPLSPGYAAQKQKAIGHSRADLTVSGRMLNDLRVYPAEKRVTLAFSSAGGTGVGRTLIQRSRAVGAADKAFWHQVSGAGKRRVLRQFFDLNAADEAFIIGRLDRAVADEIR